MTPTVPLDRARQRAADGRIEREDVTWTAESKLKIQGYGEITLEDYGVAIGGTPEAGEFTRTNLVRAVGAVLNNPWQPVILESAEHGDRAQVRPRHRAAARRRAAWRREIDAGSRARAPDARALRRART